MPEAVGADGQQEANVTDQTGTQTEQQPEHVKVPKKKPKRGKAGRKARVRGKKELKKSVIRRMCRIPSEDGSRVDNRDAEIMYTNSQFGQSTQACNRSSCQVCALAPRRRIRIRALATAAAKAKSKTKRLMPLAKRRTTAKVGRPRKSASARQAASSRQAASARKAASSRKSASVRPSGAGSISNLDPACPVSLTGPQGVGPTRQCLCTELNGQVYKLMDLPASIDCSSALMFSLRRQQLMRQSKPRLNTKRQVGKHPTSSQKLSKQDPN